MRLRLALLSFLQFAVWGAYLTSMGGYLAAVGMGASIGWFYAVQGFVSLVMPALMGFVADRWIPAQRLLSLCHVVSSTALGAVGSIALECGEAVTFPAIFPWFVLAVAFYMPTLPLSYSVSYSALEGVGLDAVKAFPPIRIWGTIGFIASMWIVDLLEMSHTAWQFLFSAGIGFALAAYSLSLPSCPVSGKSRGRSLAGVLGLDAFSLFRQRKMALFFIFAVLMGVNLHITNGYANPFISSFAADAAHADAFVVKHAGIVISLSQCSEALCILLIPFFMPRLGIKRVALIAMAAWMLRFGFFAIGSPDMPGVLWLLLSMIVYGVAFDFFNVSGSLFVNREVDTSLRSSAQGMFVLMTNGFGASIGMLAAQAVVNSYTQNVGGNTVGDWPTVWGIFAAYAFVVAVMFSILFRYKEKK